MGVQVAFGEAAMTAGGAVVRDLAGVGEGADAVRVEAEEGGGVRHREIGHDAIIGGGRRVAAERPGYADDVPPRVELSVSRNAVTKAGKRLREWQASEGFVTEEVLEDLELVSEFRKVHAYPLQMVTAKTRYYVGLYCPERMLVAQRLKRLPTIIEKLVRTPAMALARMEDIGGCRAVVTNEAQVRAMVTHMRRRWKDIIVRERDYIDDPKPDTGYRAYHLVVDKLGSRIELQLRTQGQHAWAEFVEQTDRRNPGLGLKAGTAPTEVMEYFRLGADLTADLDRGAPLDQARLLRLGEMHRTVGKPLQEGDYGAGS